MWDKPQLLLWVANMLYALAALLLAYAVLFLVVHLPVFPLREVKVNGTLQHVTREQVQLIVKRELKGNFFTLDLDQAKSAFEKLPWIRSVSVRRRWPDRLEVAVEEHVALARWGNMALVNTKGELFGAASNGDLPVFIGLPEHDEIARAVLDGVDVTERAAERQRTARLAAVEAALSAPGRADEAAETTPVTAA